MNSLLCYICVRRREFGDTNDTPKPATHMCSDLDKPICADHAAHCEEDGHTATPMEEAYA